MSLAESPFRPPRGLRNAHVQSMLSSGPARARHASRMLAATGARHETLLLDAGDGARLQGVLSRVPGVPGEDLVVLLHGWEGSSESSYLRVTAARLLARGWRVFRLNFRDHGDTHHLNREIFHSGRIDEVVAATSSLVSRLGVSRLMVGGWSLGGNFALRLALRSRAAGLPLAGVAAVCPAIDPARTMEAMESGLPIYQRYFEHKWRRSLARKRDLFPEAHDYGDDVLRLRMRALTAHFVSRHTEYGTLDAYFDAYSIAGDRLGGLPVDADILMAEDDPVVPAADFHAIARHPRVSVELSRHGGHCGFVADWRMRGYAERWMERQVARRLGAAPAEAAKLAHPNTEDPDEASQ